MSRGRRQRDFAYETAFLSDSARLKVKEEMVRSGARPTGYWARIPFLLLTVLAAVICWLACTIASKAQISPTIAPMFILGGLLLPTAYTATRKWVFRQYYRQPIIIGA